MKVDELEWNEVDVSKSSGGRVKGLEWNEVNVGVSLVEESERT